MSCLEKKEKCHTELRSFDELMDLEIHIKDDRRTFIMAGFDVSSRFGLFPSAVLTLTMHEHEQLQMHGEGQFTILQKRK